MAFNMYVRTSVSRNMADARLKVIDLYRKACRLVPVLIAQYELSHTPASMRARIRRDFDKHNDVSDPQVVDKLLFLGMVDIEEGRNMWKQTNHVDSYFAEGSAIPGVTATKKGPLDQITMEERRITQLKQEEELRVMRNVSKSQNLQYKD